MAGTFDKPTLTVDIVPLTIMHGRLAVLLARRSNPPYAGRLALLGGYVHTDADSDLEATARRVLAEKAGIHDLFIEQLMTFSGPGRDPRGWSASVAFFSLTPADGIEPALERDHLWLAPVHDLPPLPFDHDQIVATALSRLRGKGAYSDLPARFLPEPFTLAELHHVYQIVLAEPINEDAFRRKILDRGMIEEMPGEKRRAEGAKKPSQLYRLRPGVAVFDRRL